jgi:hypothetical protein
VEVAVGSEDIGLPSQSMTLQITFSEVICANELGLFASYVHAELSV